MNNSQSLRLFDNSKNEIKGKKITFNTTFTTDSGLTDNINQ